MRALRRVAFVGLCSSLWSCAAQPPDVEKSSSRPVSEAPLGEVELAPAPRVKSATPSYVQLARVEGYGNPKTGELWMRAVPLVDGFQGFEVGGPRDARAPEPTSPSGVGVSGQELGRAPGYCEATYEADGVPNNNPNGTLEFYNQYDASGNGADQSSFVVATCYGHLDTEFQTGIHNALFTSQGVGCAYQHVGNFTGIDYNRLLLDVDVFNGSLATHGPYGPPFTTGTVTTPEGRNAPYQDLGLWDFGPMPSGTMGQTSGPHLKNMWVYFKNGDSNDFNWTGYILGEVFEDCGDDDDDDCDGVEDNGCGTYVDGADCYSDLDCASGYCLGAVVVSGQGEGGGELGDDMSGRCADISIRIDAGYRTTCRIIDGGEVECWGDASSMLFTQAPASNDNAQISLGLYDGCVVKKDGSLACWGSSTPITSGVPTGTDFRKVTVGGTHACALHNTGAVTCWGSDGFDEVTDTPTSSDFVDISSGDQHSCGVRHNGTLKCWGDAMAGQTSVPINNVYVDVEAGYRHSCALTTNGNLHCWGDNTAGQSTGMTSEGYRDVAVGHVQSCGITYTGELECWGNNSFGQHTEPSGNDFVEIVSGHYHLCAVRDDDSVVCWGDNGFLQTEVPAPVPTPELSTLTTGFYFGCTIMEDTGKVHCWGSGGSSQATGGYATQALGVNAWPLNLGSSPAVQIATGNGHGCAVFADGTLRCWGDNFYRQARGSSGGNVFATTSDAVPTPLAVGGPAVKVVTGANFTCVLRADAKLVCWGSNVAGAIGINSASSVIDLNAAAPVPLGGPVEDVCSGEGHSCALLQDHTVRCWGANNMGQLGLNGTAHVGDNETVLSAGAVPVLDGVEIAAGRYVEKIACGTQTTCAVLDDGHMRCWGDGTYGSLGYGNTTHIGDNEYINTIGYVDVGVGELVHQVTMGNFVTCVILHSGNTKCWGHTQELTPSVSCLGHPPGCGSPVMSPPVTSIDFGGGHRAVELGYRSDTGTLCARLDDGGVKCWHINGPSSQACGLNAAVNTVDHATGAYTVPEPLKVADVFLGQPGAGSTASGSGASGMNTPIGIAVDPTTGKVFTSEYFNNRVLRFASFASLTSGAAAEAVLGQPDMSTNAQGTTVNGLKFPRGIAFDMTGRLWVADYGNHRVLRFDNAASKPNGAAADGVLGQMTFVTGVSSAAANGMNGPMAVAADSAGRLWVAEAANNRVLRFDSAAAAGDGAAANGVLGQPAFGMTAIGNGPAGMYQPSALLADPLGRLWISDTLNNRVLRFDNGAFKADGAAADGVIGQTDLTTTTSGVSATKLYYPGVGLAMDGAGTLYVTDGQNQRVVAYSAGSLSTNGPTAVEVFGQADFTTATSGNTASKFNNPSSLAIDAAQHLWVVDMNNHRALMFLQ